MMLAILFVAEFASSFALFCRSTAVSLAPPMASDFSWRIPDTFLNSLFSVYKT